MNLNFLPHDLKRAIDCLNINFLTEIRIRRGQPVIIEYRGEYVYINRFGVCGSSKDALRVYDVDGLFASMLSDGVYAYAEQLKNAFVTLDGGVRVGVAGEYVTEKGAVSAVRCITSLNIRIPHDIKGCADGIFSLTQGRGLKSVLIFRRPGWERRLCFATSRESWGRQITFGFDERNEIAAADSDGDGYVLGERCDIVRGGDRADCIFLCYKGDEAASHHYGRALWRKGFCRRKLRRRLRNSRMRVYARHRSA